MCTVSIVEIAAQRAEDAPLIRIGCNRDESRRRPQALPPQLRHYGSRRAWLPIDPVSDGTWIGVNDASLMLTLLNASTSNTTLPVGGQSSATPWPINRTLLSRGTIIPSLMHCSNVAEVEKALAVFDVAVFPPFRLIAFDGASLAQWRGNGATAVWSAEAWNHRATLFTSSGLGDDLVDPPRRALFQEMMPPPHTASQQDAFHQHQWPDQPGISVCMSRDDARTVSRTTITLSRRSVELDYHSIADDSAIHAAARSTARSDASTHVRLERSIVRV